jgi:ABC-type uncharacterized transport system involved in gliding motility auxiliary subunit
MSARPTRFWSGTWAVTRREVLGLTKAPTALLFLLVFSALSNLIVLGQAGLLDRGQADLAPLFTALPWLSLLLLPALSMGVLSEERRAGSIELLFTLPLSIGQVVFGKFLAALAMAALALVSTTPMWITIAYLGSPDHGAIAAAYVGAVLLAAALLSIGTLVSALTQSPASAFVGTITIGFVFLFSDVPAIREVLPAVMTDGFARLSFAAQYEAMSRGVLSLGNVLFFVTTTGVFLTATGLLLRARRQTRRAPLIPLFAAYLVLVPLVLPFLVPLVLPFLTGWRLDCTQGGLYSLSPGTRAIVENLHADQTFTLYLAKDAAEESPRFLGFAEFVQEELRDLARASKGRIRLEIKDAAPFSIADDEARAARLSRIPLGASGGGKELVFGLVATNAAGDQRSLGFLSPESEGALEHEFARIAYELDNPERKTVGVLTSLQADIDPGHPLTGGLTGRGWQVVENTRAQFDFRALQRPLVNVPGDIDVLWILHPKSFDETTLRAIDVYAQQGGALLIQVDPLADVDTEGMDPNDYTTGFTAPRESDLAPLLNAWGLDLVNRRVLGDRTLGRELPVGAVGNTNPITMPHWVTLDAAHFETSALGRSLTGGLLRLQFSSPGILTWTGGDDLAMRPILRSTTDAMALDVSQVQVVRDPEALLRDFVPGDEQLTFGVDLVGLAPPAYTGRAKENLGPGPVQAPLSPVLNPEPMRAIVIADIDFAADLLWVRASEVPGSSHQAIAGNGPFFARVLSDLAGGAALALASSPRENARYTRPFERFDALNRASEERLARKLSDARDLEQSLSTALAQAAEAFDGQDDPTTTAEVNRITAELKDARQNLMALNRDRTFEVDVQKAWLLRFCALCFPILFVLAGLLIRWRRRA